MGYLCSGPNCTLLWNVFDVFCVMDVSVIPCFMTCQTFCLQAQWKGEEAAWGALYCQQVGLFQPVCKGKATLQYTCSHISADRGLYRNMRGAGSLKSVKAAALKLYTLARKLYWNLILSKHCVFSKKKSMRAASLPSSGRLREICKHLSVKCGQNETFTRIGTSSLLSHNDWSGSVSRFWRRWRGAEKFPHHWFILLCVVWWRPHFQLPDAQSPSRASSLALEMR